MLYLAPIDDPDYIDPAFAWPLIVILFTILLIITLVSLRRGKIKRDRQAFVARQAARREEAFTLLNERDEHFEENLKTLRRHNQESHARHR